MWIQSDNAWTQYKNKHAFGLLQKLADDFNLRTIRTYGAAGHGNGVIDTMSSFGVKNILRKDIVPVDDLLKTHHGNNSPIEIPGRMKQHLILFNPKKERFCKEYLCDCTSCLQFHFNDCINKTVSSEENLEADVGTKDIKIFYGEVDQYQRIFYFLFPIEQVYITI